MGTPCLYLNASFEWVFAGERVVVCLLWCLGVKSFYGSLPPRQNCSGTKLIKDWISPGWWAYVSAASARTFSRRWQAPPPLIQLRFESTLKIRGWTFSIAKRCNDLLVGPVYGDVNSGILVYISKEESCFHNEFFGLEAFGLCTQVITCHI